jgi:hypothetical protein
MSKILGSRLGRIGALVLVLVVVATAVVLSARAYPRGVEEPAAASAAGHVEAVAGSDESRVVLTADAVRRLGIKTEPVQAGPVAGRLTMPYAAVLYDASGTTWTYTNPEPEVFVRKKITIDTIQGGVATLSDGPTVGTAVVVVGATELYGTEFGVGGDE